MQHTKHFSSIIVFIFLLVSCSNQKPKEQNRQADQPQIVVEPVAPSGTENFNATLFSNAYVNSIAQTFITKKKEVTVVTGKKGLKVTVNPSQLETMDGQPVDGNITVTIVELTTSEELFRSNAATMSNGRLLASGGSYYVGMKCNGRELRIKGNQSVTMEFPRLKEEGMELFYGNRDTKGNINWVEADEPLEFKYTRANYTNYNPPFPDNDARKRFRSKFKMYKSLKDKVYFNNKLITIEEFAHTIQAFGADKFIDTLKVPSYEFYGHNSESRFKYDTIVRYRLVSCKGLEEEIVWKAQERKITEEREEANRRYAVKWRAGNTLEGKLEAYYAPAGVTSLGWINCDRFYNAPQLIETPVEVPYTFTNPSVQYFLIYKSFNGLMSGKLSKNNKGQFVLNNLPVGEKVTIVAFTKQDGVIFNCKEDFIVAAGKTIKPEFSVIEDKEMKKMFGANISM